uniref:Nonribosomal peptide synthetase 12 n=1 Tax=Fusarium oxysporum (strain Fo5176) TaxID=660025 RepID=A0A0D2XLS4_FUSOF
MSPQRPSLPGLITDFSHDSPDQLIEAIASTLSISLNDILLFDSFTELGGDEEAAELVRQTCQSKGFDIKSDDIMACQTLAELQTRCTPKSRSDSVESYSSSSSGSVRGVSGRAAGGTSAVDPNLESLLQSFPSVSSVCMVWPRAGPFDGQLVALIKIDPSLQLQSSSSKSLPIDSVRDEISSLRMAVQQPQIWIPTDFDFDDNKRGAQTWVQNMDEITYKEVMKLQIPTRRRVVKRQMPRVGSEDLEVFPMSSMQQLYLAAVENESESERWTKGLMVRVKGGAEPADVDAAIEAIIARHDMLRARFVKGDEWMQCVTPKGTNSYTLSHHVDVGEDEILTLINETEDTIDPFDGPVFAAMYIHNQDKQMLYLAAHQLILDSLSWRIILNDLEELLQKGTLLSEGSVSFERWIEYQGHEMEQRLFEPTLPFDVFSANLEYWDLGPDANTYGNSDRLSFQLTAEQAYSLERSSAQVLRTDSADVILAALLLSFCQVFPDRLLPTLWKQENGRDASEGDFNILETVGWFASLCPIGVSVDPETDLIEVITLIKDTRRSIPRSGVPFFNSEFSSSQGAAMNTPLEIIFNTVDTAKQLQRKNGLLEPIALPGQSHFKSTTGSDIGRIALFEVSAMMDNAGGQIDVMYSKACKFQDKIQTWIQVFEYQLLEAITKLESHEPRLTLSDIPLIQSSYQALERLTSDRRINVKDIETIQPITPAQQELLIAQSQNSESFHVHVSHELAGLNHIIDVTRLCEAWEVIVANTPALRSIFIDAVSREGLFDQVVLKKISPNILFIETMDPREAIGTLPGLNMGFGEPRHRLSVCYNPEGMMVRLDASQALCDNQVHAQAVFQLAWALVLRAFVGMDAATFGYQFSARDEQLLCGIEELVGSFATILPCYIELPPSASLGQCLAIAGEGYANARKHDNLTMSEVQHALGLKDKRLFNTCLYFHEENNLVGGDELITTPLTYGRKTDCDVSLTLMFINDRLHVNFTSRHLSTSQIQSVMNSFHSALTQILTTPQRLIVETDLLTDRDYAQLVVQDWATQSQKISSCLHDVILQHSLLRPDAEAVCSWDGDITYAQLSTLVSRLKTYLVNLGVGPGTIVPVVLEKNHWAPVIILAVLSAGASFAALDSQDASTVKSTIDYLNPHIVLATETAWKDLSSLAINLVIVNDTFFAMLTPYLSTMGQEASPDHAACVFVAPKKSRSIFFTHASLLSAFFAQGPALKLNSESRVLQLSAFNVDISLVEILGTLVHGGCVCIPSAHERSNDIASAMARMDVTWSYMTSLIARSIHPDSVPSLRTLCFRTRKLDPDTYMPWMEDHDILLAYGAPDICPLGISVTEVEKDNSLDVITPPVTGRFWVLNPDNPKKLMPVGAIGELAIDSPLVTPHRFALDRPLVAPDLEGERQRPRYLKTGHRVRYLDDGNVQFISSVRDEVRVGGLMVDVAQVEQLMRRCLGQGIDVVVDSVTMRDTGPLLAAFLQLGHAMQPNENLHTLTPETRERTYIAKKMFEASLENPSSNTTRLPRHSIPAVFIPVRAFPMSTSLKVNRRKLQRSVANLSTHDVLLMSHVPNPGEIQRICRSAESSTRKVSARKQVARKIDTKFVKEVIAPQLGVSSPDVLDFTEASSQQVRALELGMFPNRADIICLALRFNGPIDASRLETACKGLSDMHAILNVAFISHLHTVYQVHCASFKPPFSTISCSTSSLEEVTQNLIKEHQSLPFDPTTPVTNFTYLNAEQQGCLVIRLSTSQIDDVAAHLLVHELTALYEGDDTTDVPRSSYLDYTRASRVTRAQGLEYWNVQLENAKMTKIIAHTRPAAPASLSEIRTVNHTTSLGHLSSYGMTPDAALKASWAIVLSTLSSSHDVLFGEVIHTSTPDIVGPMTNILPVRVQFPSSHSTPLDLMNCIQLQRQSHSRFETFGFQELINKCTNWRACTRFSTVVQHHIPGPHDGSSTMNIDGATFTYKMVEAWTRDFPDLFVRSSIEANDRVVLEIKYSEERLTAAFVQSCLSLLVAAWETITHPETIHQPMVHSSDEISRSQRQIPLPAKQPPQGPPVESLDAAQRKDLQVSIVKAWDKVIKPSSTSIPKDKIPTTPFYAISGCILPAHTLTAELNNVLPVSITLEDVLAHPKHALSTRAPNTSSPPQVRLWIFTPPKVKVRSRALNDNSTSQRATKSQEQKQHAKSEKQLDQKQASLNSTLGR